MQELCVQTCEILTMSESCQQCCVQSVWSVHLLHHVNNNNKHKQQSSFCYLSWFNMSPATKTWSLSKALCTSSTVDLRKAERIVAFNNEVCYFSWWIGSILGNLSNWDVLFCNGFKCPICNMTLLLLGPVLVRWFVKVSLYKVYTWKNVKNPLLFWTKFENLCTGSRSMVQCWLWQWCYANLHIMWLHIALHKCIEMLLQLWGAWQYILIHQSGRTTNVHKGQLCKWKVVHVFIIFSQWKLTILRHTVI